MLKKNHQKFNKLISCLTILLNKNYNLTVNKIDLFLVYSFSSFNACLNLFYLFKDSYFEVKFIWQELINHR